MNPTIAVEAGVQEFRCLVPCQSQMWPTDGEIEAHKRESWMLTVFRQRPGFKQGEK